MELCDQTHLSTLGCPSPQSVLVTQFGRLWQRKHSGWILVFKWRETRMPGGSWSHLGAAQSILPSYHVMSYYHTSAKMWAPGFISLVPEHKHSICFSLLWLPSCLSSEEWVDWVDGHTLHCRRQKGQFLMPSSNTIVYLRKIFFHLEFFFCKVSSGMCNNFLCSFCFISIDPNISWSSI